MHVTLDGAITYFNLLLHEDPVAVNRLFDLDAPCSTIQRIPSIVTQEADEETGQPELRIINPLAVINGMFGSRNILPIRNADGFIIRFEEKPA